MFAIKRLAYVAVITGMEVRVVVRRVGEGAGAVMVVMGMVGAVVVMMGVVRRGSSERERGAGGTA